MRCNFGANIKSIVQVDFEIADDLENRKWPLVTSTLDLDPPKTIQLFLAIRAICGANFVMIGEIFFELSMVKESGHKQTDRQTDRHTWPINILAKSTISASNKIRGRFRRNLTMQSDRARRDASYDLLLDSLRPILKKWRAFLSSSWAWRAGGGVAYIEI